MRRLNKKGNLRSDFGMSMRNIAKSKRAAEMTIGTLVVIVLAIIVLVVIALGFGMGWSNLWSKITGYFGGDSNVDSIKQACSYACTTNAVYDYCCAERNIKYSKTSSEKSTCVLSKTKIGLTDCGITCGGDNAGICDTVKCLATDGIVGIKTACPEDRRDTSKTLNANGVPIAATDVCCKQVAAQKCTGAATACTALTAQIACSAQQGCDWTGTPAKCTGIATACTALTTQAECSAQKVCTWS